MTLEAAKASPVVLVAEDDVSMRALYREILAKQGLTVVETGSGSDVVGLVRRHGPKIVLLDVSLPGLAGDEVLRALKSDTDLSGIPVIAATGSSSRDIQEWKAAGFDDVLFKPISLDDLISTVLRYVD